MSDVEWPFAGVTPLSYDVLIAEPATRLQT
jgi:hypothetical protein